ARRATAHDRVCVSMTVQILDAKGQPMRQRTSPLALTSRSNVPYDAADRTGAHVADWNPYLWSPDGELNGWRDTIVSRMRDLVRNDGWASGAITRVLDNAVGANFRPIAKPDWKALAYYTGIKAFDATWANEYAKALDASYRTWALSDGRWSDAQRRLTIPQMYRVAFRHRLVDGDNLIMSQWRPERCAPGKARYATAMQLIDPDRLSNPNMGFDQQHYRGGVEIDDDGVAIAYHIRAAHQGDWFAGSRAYRWDRIERETEWGRPVMIHDYDSDRADQHRGGVGILGPVVQRLKMLFRYDVAELDAAILNAIFGAWLESPLDPEFAAEAFGSGGDDDQGGGGIGEFQANRADYHRDARIRIPGAGPNLPQLFPGEALKQLDNKRPTSNFIAFEKAALRNVAQAAGMSAQQVSNDWSDVNYSSARGAMLEFWKTMTRRRDDFATGTCQPVYSCFVEEAHEIDDVPLPAGAPEFFEFREAYARAKWIGPGRGWIDPVNEVKGAILGMDSALMSYDDLCAEQGIDGDDMIAERAQTIKRFKEAGVPLPTWAGIMPGGDTAGSGTPAGQTIQDPEAR
ncbi:phage portal protein, partial [Sphingomonas paucimobilis]|uniref:phage portal protein n=1 Tax=Sphingomonas paucimobilis TaxID=13689 RepID=UPI000AB2B5A6